MTITDDDTFTFDVQGYLHLRGRLTSVELAEYRAWIEQAQGIDPKDLNADNPTMLKHLLNRPLSRVLDGDTRFASFLDHPAVEPYLVKFLGQDYRHIDNELYFTDPGYAGGGWHRGVRAHPTGHVRNGEFICPMVKVFYCMTDVGPGQGEFVVIPGSHKAQFKIELQRIDLPAQHVFDDVVAGDVIIFNEALLHTGRPNPSRTTRQTIIMNFGRADAGAWTGYTPRAETLAAVTPRQRAILTNAAQVWAEPVLVDVL